MPNNKETPKKPIEDLLSPPEKHTVINVSELEEIKKNNPILHFKILYQYFSGFLPNPLCEAIEKSIPYLREDSNYKVHEAECAITNKFPLSYSTLIVIFGDHMHPADRDDYLSRKRIRKR